ncbi:MAG: DUF3299 domain-containing protein [Rhodanobacteraceae bacterium]|nr:DUF3299 domain-containing protein [Rhodanobacteraceae bacterium]
MRVLPLITALLLLTATPLMAADQAARELDWLELMPKDEVDSLMDTPAVTHEGSFKQVQTGSFRAIKELNGLKVKIAGYIVPVEVDGDSQMSEFFIVPYFGACIHVPPPPPNQIILARLAKPIPVTEIYDAYWIEGTLNVEQIKNDIAASAYTLTTTKVSLWE